MTHSALVRPKSAFNEESTNHSGLHNKSMLLAPNPSFFAGIGGSDWSLEAMVRRACSGCFKVFPSNELTPDNNNCFYCGPCLAREVTGVSLNESMIRDYKH